MDRVSFTRMIDGTTEEYAFLHSNHVETKAARHVESLLALLRATGEPAAGYQVSRYEHALQSATRALRDGADEEWVVAALLHDVGDLIAPDDHASVAAALLRPYVSARTHWVVQKHGIFQGHYFWHHYGLDRNARDKYRDHPWFDACEYFCWNWDQNAFDPDYETLPLEAFEPMVRRIFAREPYSMVDALPAMRKEEAA